ncbi:ankyrin repeat-containing domain protein [Fusarium oxysporum]|nr:ankyrin repeat-containing domain protein [Fusarium oxysporum]
MRPRQPQRGTCEWIFNHPKYRSWLYANHLSMLLLTGRAGSGKSVLSRCIAERIQSRGVDYASNSRHIVVTHFCSYVEAALNSEEVVLRTILHQLVQLNPASGTLARNALEDRTITNDLVLNLGIERLQNALLRVLSMQSMGGVIIIIDAIEELGHPVAIAILEYFLRTLETLRQHNNQNRLRIFVSSRPSAMPPKNEFYGLKHLDLDSVNMKKDIRVYLENSIDDLARLNASFGGCITPQLREQIATKISKAADDMFLAAVLSWENFQKGMLWNQDVVTRKLEHVATVGKGMASFYDQLMGQIDQSAMEDVLEILSLITAAARPLFEHEINIILGICRSKKPIKRSTDIPSFQSLYGMIENTFPELVKFQDNGTVTFYHLSLKDYLESQKKFESFIQNGYRSIAEACLTYLKLTDMLRSCADGLKGYKLNKRYPFISYAASHFMWHIGSFPADDPLWMSFADTAGEFSVYNLMEPKPFRMKSPLHYIVSDQIIPETALDLIRRFNDHSYDMNDSWSLDACGEPLSYCCAGAYGSEFLKEAALLLLELGANPNLPERPYELNLTLVLRRRVWDLYDALFCHPMTDLSARNKIDRTLLHDLVKLGPDERTAELLDIVTEIDLNAQDCEGYSPLHVAVILEKEEAARMLIDKPGIRLDLRDNMGRTPLTVATYLCHTRMALILISKSEAFPVASHEHVSPLVLAAKGDEKDLCLQLLESCNFRNLNLHVDMSGKGILHQAAIKDWHDIINSCLSRGGLTINVNQIDHSGRGPLHYAASLGNVRSCRALLQGGASQRLQDRLGRTAVHEAADAGFKDTLMLLLQHGGIDPNQRDHEGRNLVHWAATLDCVDVMDMVCQMPGVKLDQRDRHGKTPLDIAFVCQSKHVGLFLSSKLPHLNFYSWDLLYSSPEVAAEKDEDIYVKMEDDLLMRNSLRQQAANAEYERLQEKYPTELWGLQPFRG